MKMTKKILSLALSLAALSAMSVNVYAVDENTTINEADADKTAPTEVNMTVSPYYTVTIPTTVELDSSAKISATVFVKSLECVKVTLSDTDDFKVTNEESQSLDYEVKTDGAIWEKDDYVAFEEDGEVQLDFITKQTDTMYSGKYEGTLTFTVSCETVTL